MNTFDDFTVLQFYGMLNIRNADFMKEELLKTNLWLKNRMIKG